MPPVPATNCPASPAVAVQPLLSHESALPRMPAPLDEIPSTPTAVPLATPLTPQPTSVADAKPSSPYCTPKPATPADPALLSVKPVTPLLLELLPLTPVPFVLSPTTPALMLPLLFPYTPAASLPLLVPTTPALMLPLLFPTTPALMLLLVLPYTPLPVAASTSSLATGLFVPIPTLPLELTLRRLVPPVAIFKVPVDEEKIPVPGSPAKLNDGVSSFP